MTTLDAPGSVYSGAKIAAWPDAIAAARDPARTPPVLHLNVDLTNLCSQRCWFCMWGDQDDVGGLQRSVAKGASLDHARLAALPAEIARAGVKGVEITGGGEPTLHHGFPAFAEGLMDRGVKVGLITNGDRLHHHLATVARCTFVRVSITSLHEDIHAAQRRPNGSRGIAGILDSCARLAAKATHPESRLGIGVTVDASNYAEVYTIAERAKAIGFDNVRFTMTWANGRDYAAIWPVVQAQAAAARADFDGAAFRVHGPEEWLGYQQGAPKRYARCAYACFVANLTADGRVWPCCVTRYLDGWDLGSIYEEPLDAILLGARRNAFVRAIDPARCPPCIWDPKNETMGALVFAEGLVAPPPDPLPLHKEFI